MNIPSCFDSRKQYQSWCYFNKVSRCNAKICDDCTPEYKIEMQLQERCHPEVKVKPHKEIVRKCSKCGETNPDNFHPSRFYTCKECMNAYKRARYAKYA